MKKYLGQHFLRNKTAIGKIIAALDLQTGDNLVEIGPGKGILTCPLLEKIKDLRGKLIAIEKDKALAAELLGAVDNLGNNVDIVTGDALKELPGIVLEIASQKPGNDSDINWKLVGNIPYYITGYLFRIIGELKNKPKITVLMIQKEVAERVTAGAGRMSLLAAATQIWADISVISTLKPSDFEPAPKVESAIIKLNIKNKKINSAEINKYYKFIKIAFKQPRKTLLNNILAVGGEKENILNILRQEGYDEKTRAQDLNIEELLKLSEKIAL